MFYLQIQPVYKRQSENFDKMLRCLTHLIYLLKETAKTEEEHEAVLEMVKKLLCSKPRSALYGDTLLHLCSSRLNTCSRAYIAGSPSQVQPTIFPNVRVVQLLIEAGAPVNVRNQALCTPLHIAANTYNFNPEVSFLRL